jgi:NADH oxidase (H2O2-forming)
VSQHFSLSALVRGVGNMKIVIIGNGIAGNHVASKVREINKEDDITILSAEAVPEYDPCSLPYFLGGEVKREAVFRKRMEYYEEQKIDLMLNSKALSIDANARCVKTENNLQIGYDKLVLAHGGQLFIPPIEGISQPGVFSCKQLAETEKLYDNNGRSAVVIGSGAIGIEVAEALKKKGYEVTVVELMEWILPALFDRETAMRLEARLAGYGIRVFTSEKVLAIQGGDAVERVITDKRILPCDTVVIATGVIPGISLARTAGIKVGRGIKTNEKMETNMDGIYACGDCVETVDLCTGEDAMFQLKHNAIDQAAVVAANLLGQPCRYAGAYAFARVHFLDIHAASFGKTTLATKCELGELEIIDREYGSNFLRVIVKEDAIVGGQVIGDFAGYLGFLISAMRRRDRFSHTYKRGLAEGLPNSSFQWRGLFAGGLLGPT